MLKGKNIISSNKSSIINRLRCDRFLELSDQELNEKMINMIKILMYKMDIMKKQMGNVSREVET